MNVITNPEIPLRKVPSAQVETVEVYRTSDLYFSAFLCALDMPLKATEKEPSSSKVVFVFEMKPAVLIQFKRLYFGGQGTVVASKFVDHMRRLKSLCYI